MYIEIDELKTHLRKEQAALIAGADDTVIEAAIDTATAEIKGYLTKFDIKQIFDEQGKNRNALLLTFCKDIAVYHLINMCAPGVHYELRERRYDRAIEWLKDVQRGNIMPDLPIAMQDAKPISAFYISSNSKRKTHF